MTLPETDARILIIEDESLIRLSLRSRLEKEGFRVDEAETMAEGLEAISSTLPDLILLDYRLPDGDGIELLRRIEDVLPQTVVIFMTAHGTVETAVQAMQLGAYTYLNKPFDMEDLVARIRKGLETTALRREVDRLRERHQAMGNASVLIAESPAMREVLETVKKINAVGAATILLRGENGTGKDVIAHAIHETSSRRDRPFQNITCTALPDALLESELFGHEKGAFTDARQRKLGLLELADGGMVFLDEIGDMSLNLQAKLLRFLEEKAFRRVGGTEDRHVDVRVIAATNRDLEAAVAAGEFRQDLFYRLSVIPVEVPALRDRPEDVRPLAQLFIDRFNREFKRRIQGLSPDALRILESHRWPGNVRELRNVIERAMILSGGDHIDVSDLPRELTGSSAPAAVAPLSAEAAENGDAGAFGVRLPDGGIVLEDLERDLVIQALERTHHNQTRAARLLGMTRDQIRYRVEKFRLSPQREKSRSRS